MNTIDSTRGVPRIRNLLLQHILHGHVEPGVRLQRIQSGNVSAENEACLIRLRPSP